MKNFLRIATSLFLCFILHGAQGSPLSTLHSFSVFPQGAQPEAALMGAGDGNFYGTTAYGGTNGGNGTIFRLTPGGHYQHFAHILRQ
ncbi:MAG TPA: choice-of-anchor tandem repeat GloVer-containing protein [Verrucomicrobiae bacterium]|nr:choice-of-anchor tandem repeat GloVer-containing protein [Verrucomicrobiae bacterium]